MRGHIVKRYKSSWSIWLTLGYKTDPVTGKTRQVQKCFSCKGTRKDAEDKLTELLKAIKDDQFVEPSKMTCSAWFDEWLEKIVKPTRRLNTYDSYKNAMETAIKPAIGTIPLQKLKAADLSRFYIEFAEKHAVATVTNRHCIISSALKAAKKQGLVVRNVAEGALAGSVAGVDDEKENILENVWSAEEARKFLKTAKLESEQESALWALALDSGMRRGELCGLKWADVNLDKGIVHIKQQLIRNGPPPIFGPLKKKWNRRDIDVSAETVTLLREHRRVQRELMMANRTTYTDMGLVFAKRFEELTSKEGDALGMPLIAGHLTTPFSRLAKKAGVKRITPHGTRHTSATLALRAGVPVHIVAQRLGHKNGSITLSVYAHVLAGDQSQATAALAKALHG